jgi:acetoin utilization deacetylase AcuC-like enzyme
MSSIAYVSDRECLLHDMGAGHPECPARIQAVEDKLIALRLMDTLQRVAAPHAERDDLLRVHDARYVDAIERSAPQSGLVLLDPDTAMNPHTLGAAVKATDLVIGGEAGAAFCNVRPPGHHAERRRAMGFCLFNNVAVAAARALDHHGLQRVAIVDFDVHHGNGTEDIFRDDPRVMMVSTFQHPFYPFSGVEGRSERMVNIPLPAGAGGVEFRAAVTENWLPALERFRPEMIFVSAGFDAHRDDSMAMLRFTDDDYVWVTEQITEAARTFAGGRIVSVLEGGYELEALGRSAAVHVRVLQQA